MVVLGSTSPMIFLLCTLPLMACDYFFRLFPRNPDFLLPRSGASEQATERGFGEADATKKCNNLVIFCSNYNLMIPAEKTHKLPASYSDVPGNLGCPTGKWVQTFSTSPPHTSALGSQIMIPDNDHLNIQMQLFVFKFLTCKLNCF